MEDAARGQRYRYWLHRDVADTGKAGLVFVMLNPSTADDANDDPTIRRCIAFAQQWGYRELTVVNLFALRATRPRDLLRQGEQAIGERNDEVLRWVVGHPDTSTVVAAWGNHGDHLKRAAAVLPIIAPVMALRTTKRGCPAHPLYVPKSARPCPYRSA